MKMQNRFAKLSDEALETVQKAEKKLAELGLEIVLVAYEAEK